MRPLLCITVTGRTMEELRRGRDAAAGADVVELRLDGVERPDVNGALEGRRRPVIVTCRARWEGGTFDGSEEERGRILSEAVTGGAEFVDVEARAEFAPVIMRQRRGRGVVLSFHAFGAMPGDLASRFSAMRSTGAEVVKIAIEASRLTDLLPLFTLAGSAGAERGEAADGHGHVLIAMGQAGVPSRVLAARLGNRWTYAGNAVAPGQLPPGRLTQEFHFRRISADAALYGVVGNPIAHSLSPAMHNAGFAALGLNATYLPLQAADAGDFVAFAKAVGLRGASITAPFKVDLLSRVDDVEPLAKRVGAINTIAVRDGRWFGANTDVHGFIAPLAGRMALKGTRAAVLGAGGAARAVAVALLEQGASVAICARREDAAREVATASGARLGTFPPRPGTWDVLVNTIPLTESSEASPMAGVPLDGEIVFDLIYAPADTPLLAQARADGCMTIGGIEMLVAQAEKQFEMWTGQRPPAGLFQAAVDRTGRVTTGADAGAKARRHEGAKQDI
jgi:3-dehydroquinate dehydratase/shikimate dehydrogenase